MFKSLYIGISYLVDALMSVLKRFLNEDTKLQRLLQGRSQSWNNLNALPQKTQKRIWAHAASLGEFQMLLPLLEALESTLPVEIHITFFSPSGYEHAEIPQNWHAYYLQQDTPVKAKRFLTLLQPDIAVFAKYEFWLVHLETLNQRNIPFIYWNTLLRENHFLTKFWAKPWRNELKKAQLICCQNESTQILFNRLLPKTTTLLTGDIRFLQTAKMLHLPSIFTEEQITALTQKPMILWGSSWQHELEVLLPLLPLNQNQYQLVIAPHDVSEHTMQHIEQQLTIPHQRLSDWLNHPKPNVVIMVDGIGKLKFLYRCASLAIVGGGFTNALHNIIEPLSCGVPVVFGSHHKKFPEAQQAVDAHAALHAANPQELTDILRFLLFHKNQKKMLQYHRSKAQEFFAQNTPNMSEVLPYCVNILTK